MIQTRNPNPLLALALIATLDLQGPTVLAQGSLTPPPGAPAPTMKTLDQIEARTPISSAPITISNPGSYYLTTNLSVSGGDAITIAASGVTLDLSGFTITSTAPGAAGNGILINSGLRNLAILNGFIQGGVTNNGGAYSGSGFGFGIYGFPQNARVCGVSVAGCLYLGIYLGTGDSTLVDSCTVRTVGSVGIMASIIKASVAKDCGDSAILGFQVADCRGESTSGSGLIANTALNCYGSSSSGTGLNAYTAENCQGESTSGVGLNANSTALNCSGTSTSSHGVVAITALNCSGSSSSGAGLRATLAHNCRGESSSSYGLTANMAHNCLGQSSGGTGLDASRTAQDCQGFSAGSGDGVHAFIVNNCFGESSSGYGVYAVDIAIGSYGSTISGLAGLRAWIGNSSDGNTMAVNYKFNMP